MGYLLYTRTEPQEIRRGFKWTYRVQLLTKDAEGNRVPQSLTGFTITPELTVSEGKTSTAAPASISYVVVSTEAGIFDVFVLQTQSDNLVAGKTYDWRVYVNHATLTGGDDYLVRDGKVRVPA